MKLCISKGKNSTIFYLGESFRDRNGKSTTRIVAKLGSLAELQEKLGKEVDVEQWAKEYVKELNAKKKSNLPIAINLELEADISYKKGEVRSLNVGYMFLRKILYSLGFEKIIAEITKRHSFYYDYGNILADLIYARILAPKSKGGSLDFYGNDHFETPTYSLHAVYRALEVTIRENDFIQNCIYEAKSDIAKHSTDMLYYYCSNFYFEIPEADEVRQYGQFLENRPNPVVQMGLFMDGSFIPLALNIISGCGKKKKTTTALEEQIIKDFQSANSTLVICAEASLHQTATTVLNPNMDQAFIMIRPVKSLDQKLQEWTLNPGRSLMSQPIRRGENPDVSYQDLALNGWRCNDLDGLFSLDDIDEGDPDNLNRLYYKERYIVIDKDSSKLQRLIVSYSVNHKNFMQRKRARDLEMAVKLIKQRAVKKADLNKTNDVTRYIKVSDTKDPWGEIKFELDREEILLQSSFDGFFVVSTSFNKYQKSAREIAQIGQELWQIEESFRFLKTEFKARPIFLKTEDEILAHSIICFMALTVIRTLQKLIDDKRKQSFSTHDIIQQLRKMRVTKLGRHFTGSFTRTDFTDTIQRLMDMRFDCHLITESLMTKNVAQSRKKI